MKNLLIFTSLLICTSFTTFTMEKDGHQKRKDCYFHSMDDIEDNNIIIASSTTQTPQTSITQSQDIPQDKLKEFADQLNISYPELILNIKHGVIITQYIPLIVCSLRQPLLSPKKTAKNFVSINKL